MIEERLHSVEAAATRLGITRRETDRRIVAGELRSVKIGRRRLVPESALVEFMHSLQAPKGGAA